MDRISDQKSRRTIRQAARAVEYIRLMDGFGACNALTTLKESERLGVISQRERDLLALRVFQRLACDVAMSSRKDVEETIACLRQAALDRSEVTDTVLAGLLLRGKCRGADSLETLAETAVTRPLLALAFTDACEYDQGSEPLWSTYEGATMLMPERIPS